MYDCYTLLHRQLKINIIKQQIVFEFNYEQLPQPHAKKVQRGRAGITLRNCKNNYLGKNKIHISTSKALLIGTTHTRPSNQKKII